jgi:hypothetical protein
MIAACGHFRFSQGKMADWALDVEPNLKLG